MNRRNFIAGLGGAAAWPLAARAQQPAMPVVGYLSGLGESDYATFTAAFRKGLSEQGYIERRNVEILYRWAELQYDRLPGMAADLVRQGVAVIFASGGPNSSLAAESATATIPIVFENGGSPVELGLVASFNRPGGNITGVSFITRELTAKRLQLLHEIAPAATSIGFLVNPNTPTAASQIMEGETAARVIGVRLVIANAGASNEIEAAFANLTSRGIDALMYGGDPLFVVAGPKIAALALRHRIPAIYASREEVEAGGLMSYGASITDAGRLAGTYVGRILRGEKPGDLPVQQSTRIETVVNLKVAKALGIEMPTSILLRADQVIE
jgi:putative tryptophan/tyrosine transport system substrate-binding protein